MKGRVITLMCTLSDSYNMGGGVFYPLDLTDRRAAA